MALSSVKLSCVKHPGPFNRNALLYSTKGDEEEPLSSVLGVKIRKLCCQSSYQWTGLTVVMFMTFISTWSQNVAFKVVVLDNASRHPYHLGLTNIHRQARYLPQNINPFLSHSTCASLWHSRTITLDAPSAVSRMKVRRPMCVTECWNMYNITDYVANT